MKRFLCVLMCVMILSDIGSMPVFAAENTQSQADSQSDADSDSSDASGSGNSNASGGGKSNASDGGSSNAADGGNSNAAGGGNSNASDSGSSDSANAAESASEVGFSVDTINKYDGMNNTYQEGYIPTVADNKAVVVLPLVPDGEIKDNLITAKVDYGTDENLPFKHRNYEKIFGYDPTYHIYYVRFDMDLIKNRKNGTYPVNITITAKDKNSNKIIQTFTVYVLIEDGVTETPATEQDTENSTTRYLSIETNKRYSTMEQPYKNGYAPKIKNNRVKIILPLQSSEKLKGNKVTAAVDFGTAENSPFVYKNYEKEFTCGKDDVYCVEFTINMQKKRYNGIYPVTVKVSANTAKGEEVAQDFVIYIAVTDGKNPSDDTAAGDDSTSEPKPTSEPIVLVSSYDFDKEKLNSGDKFTVKVKLKNNSNTKSIQNMVVSLDYDVEKFLCLDDSESVYISKLTKGSTREISFSFQINKGTAEGNYKIALALSYDDSGANKLTSSGVIMVPVRQESKVQMTAPQIAGSVYSGDTLPLDFQVMNLGRSTVYNVRCDIKGEGLVATSTAFIGNLDAGTEGTAMMNLFISTKDGTEGSTSTDKYGMTEGTIILTYEDADGKEYTSESTFETNIVEPEAPQVQKEEQKSAGQWWISVLIVAVIIAVIILICVIRNINQKMIRNKRRSGDEEL